MAPWERLALRAARREAAHRRFFRRTHGENIENYGAWLRRNKRRQNIQRDFDSLRSRSVTLAYVAGVGAHAWQDVYYREIVNLGEAAPAQVVARWAAEAAA